MSAIDTTCVQGGYQPGNGESRTPPIIQATTFKYTSSEQMSRLFDLSESGYFYTRLQNPTNDMVAAKICEMEGGAIAQVCLRNNVRFTAVKSVSDHLFSDNQVEEYFDFGQALENLGRVVLPLAQALQKEEI